MLCMQNTLHIYGYLLQYHGEWQKVEMCGECRDWLWGVMIERMESVGGQNLGRYKPLDDGLDI